MEDISYDKQVDEIIKDNKLFRFASELQCTTEDARKLELTEEIKNLNISKQSNEEKAKKKIEDMCKVITVNSGKKKWFRLNKDIQMEKLLEYIERSKTDKSTILKLYTDGKLKGKKIIYNDEKGIIEKITI
jgi:hypothetical protein